MKKYLILFFIVLFCSPVFGKDNFTDKIDYDRGEGMFVICTPNKKMCSVGKHTITATGEPLFISDGIVCSHNRKTCTNGFTYMRSTTPIEIVANSVLCTKNKKVCAIGKHKISTNSTAPLYIEDGIVCTPDKRTCSNGFSYIKSTVPLK